MPKARGRCAYCGEMVPRTLLRETPDPDHTWRWEQHAQAHAPTCRWVLTKGLRRDPVTGARMEPSHP